MCDQAQAEYVFIDIFYGPDWVQVKSVYGTILSIVFNFLIV